MDIISTYDLDGEERKKILDGIFNCLNAFRVDSGYEMEMAISFGGDRLSCISDFAAVVDDADDDEVIGVASFAKDGEQMDGRPALVGIFVHPDHRTPECKLEIALIHKILSIAAMCDVFKVYFDMMDGYEKSIVEQLPENLRDCLEIQDVASQLWEAMQMSFA